MKKNLRFIPSLLLMLSIILFCGGYYRYMNMKYISQMNYELLGSEVSAQSKAMQAIIDEQFAILEILGSEITAAGENVTGGLAVGLDAAIRCDASHFSLLAYAHGGVNAIYSTGEVHMLGEDRGCIEAMQGKKTILPVKSAKLDGEEYIVFYMPVRAGSGDEISGVLIAGYDMNSFRDIITASSGGGNALALVCDKQGDIVVCSRGINELNGTENIFTTLTAASIADKADKNVREDMEALRSGVIKYSYRDNEFYFACCPIGVNDWIGVRIMRAEDVEGSGRIAKQRGYLTMSVTVLSIILGAILIIRRERDFIRNDSESRVNLMISQIKPHFMYNTLSAIIALIDIDPSSAKKMVYNFSKYMRTNIDVLNFDKRVSFSNELSHTRAYVEIEKVRFPDEITIKYDISVDDFLVPPLTVQPIVENAVKHGIHAKRGGTVTVSSTETKDGFVIIVSDDGMGFDTSAAAKTSKKASGIDNVRARLKKMCDGTLEIESTPGAGTTATITVPLSNRINEKEREDSYK